MFYEKVPSKVVFRQTSNQTFVFVYIQCYSVHNVKNIKHFIGVTDRSRKF